MLSLDASVRDIPRYGKLFAKRCAALGITTIRDLLLYFPYRTEDLSRVVAMKDVKIGEIVTVKGNVRVIQNRRSPRKRMLLTEALIQDTTGTVKALWFNQGFLTRVLHPGENVWISGRVVDEGYGMCFKNPVYEKVTREALHTARIVPIYSVRERMTQKQLRILIRTVLPFAAQLPDILPESLKKEHALRPFSETVSALHFPKDTQAFREARRRMAFEELFLLQLTALKIKKDCAEERAPSIPFAEGETRRFVRHLPFLLTDDQRRAAWEILQDMARPHPMHRLLEGDVGSGKTVVAALALLNAALSQHLGMLMAPTEILAEQHFATLAALFRDWPIGIGLLTRSRARTAVKGESQETTRLKLRNAVKRGEITLLVGTHALLTEKKFSTEKLALVIVDEQHRFGVAQRKIFGEKQPDGCSPHFLSMTATPIPRTIALTIFSDLDLSVLKTFPKGRKPVMTRIVSAEQRNRAYRTISEEIEKGRQAFVVCPLIDPSDTLGVRAATDVAAHLQEAIFSEYRVALLHGRMKSKEREAVMADFANGKSHILVATTVVEVGIDVPNATIMMIEGAERFGLAQLHQLRGRVGRGAYQSFCFLFTDSEDETVQRRLRAVVASHDGFALAEKDLQFRGPGELFGSLQSGYLDLRFAHLHDHRLIEETRRAAQALVERDPILVTAPLLRAHLEKTFLAHPE